MNQKNLPFLGFIAVYIAVIVIFLGITVYETNKNVVPISSSPVPVLLEDKLNTIVKQLDETIKIDPPAKIDLSKFNFGKNEPFGP